MGGNGSRQSNVPIIFRRSDDALNERLYPYEATLFRVSDVQKKRHCSGRAILFGRRDFVERGLFNWRDSSGDSFGCCPHVNSRSRPHLTDHVQSDHYLQERARQPQDPRLWIKK